MGKLADKLSTDVKIKGKKVATKGSVAKHDSPVHMQLPGTIKFQNDPKKEGEVTGSTIDTVKVDGKPVAVIGSSVTTCNDIGMRDNSKIFAAEMAINMPAIADPMKSEAYEREHKAVEEKKGEEKQLDDTFTENPRGETVKDGRKSVYIPKDSDGMPIPLKKQRVNGQDIPLPDPAADGRPHTVLGGKLSSETGEIYRQSATFPATTWPKANGMMFLGAKFIGQTMVSHNFILIRMNIFLNTIKMDGLEMNLQNTILKG